MILPLGPLTYLPLGKRVFQTEVSYSPCLGHIQKAGLST